MSDPYLRAKKLFEANQFREAYDEFLEISSDSGLSLDDRIDTYQCLFKCLEYEKQIKIQRDLDREYLELLFDSKKYIQAKNHLRLVKDNGQARYLRLKWQIEYELGNVEEVINAINSEIDHFAKRGQSALLEELKDQVIEKKISFELELLIELIVSMIRGEYTTCLNEITNAYKEKNTKITKKRLGLLNEAYQKLSVKMRSAVGKSLIGKCVEINSLLGKKELSLEELKKSASLIFEAISLGLDSSSSEAMVCEYTLKSRRKEFFLLCEEVFREKKGFYQQLYRQMIEPQVEKYSPMRTIDQSEMDFGTDLFREDNNSHYDLSARKERMVREILILQRAGKSKEANELIRELEKIDDEHLLVKELNESYIGTNASRLLKKRDGIDEIVRRITNEISVQSKLLTQPEEVQESWGALLIKNIEYMEPDEFKKSQRDLIVSCLDLSFPEIAQKVLDDERGSINPNSLDYDYFKISILMNQRKDHLALDYCNEILQKKVLIESESLTFLYLKAELLRALGKRIEAIKIYRKVWEIDPGYRLAKYRMLEIDQY